MDWRVIILFLAALPLPANAQCRLCAAAPISTESRTPVRALSIDVEAVLDFSRVAQSSRGGGSVDVDARSGTRTVSGLVDLGGMALKGAVRIMGEPGRRVRISIPPTITLTAEDGSVADVVDVRSDLSPDSSIGADGILSFSFGGRLVVTGGTAGEFKGRIPITADYQ